MSADFAPGCQLTLFDTRPFTRVAEVTRGPHSAQRWRPVGARTGRSPAHARTPRRYERRSRARPRRRRACQRCRADQVELRRARAQLGQGRARKVPRALVRALQVDEARLRQARRGVQGLLLCRDRCASLARHHQQPHHTRTSPRRGWHRLAQVTPSSLTLTRTLTRRRGLHRVGQGAVRRQRRPWLPYHQVLHRRDRAQG